jgi:hypothetical protein
MARTSWPLAPEPDLVGLVHDHALGEQALERLGEIEMAGLAHGAGEKARIEQVQDRVLDAADILIDRQPVIGGLRIGRRVGLRCGEAGEIPGRVDERVHRVGFAAGRLAAFRAIDIAPGRVAVERIARLLEIDVVGQLTGRSAFGTGTTPQSSQWMTGIGQPQ